MDNEKNSKNKTKKVKVVSRIFYNFFLIWGSLGLILLALSIVDIDTGNLLINIGGLLTNLLGSWFATVGAVIMISLDFWWLCLLLGYGMKRIQKQE